MRAVRQAVTRARRAGATVRIRRHRDIAADEMAEVIERADAWRDTDDERGFSMALGRLGDPADGDCLLVEAVQNDGSDVVAMLSLVPWGTNGVSLDLMRRSPQSPNGTIELMVSELCMQSEDIGVTRISLNFAMFRSAFEQGAQLGAGPVARLWRWLAGVLLPLVAAGDAVPVEHEVPAGVGAALRLLRGRPAGPAGRRRLGDRRRLPGAAVLATRTSSPTPATTRRAGELWSRPGCCTPTARAPDVSGLAADLPDDERPPRLPEQVRVRMAKLKALQDDGVDAYPVGQPPSHTVAQALAGPTAPR